MKFVFLGFIFCTNLWAALPPFAQSSREIQAVLADERTFEALGSAETIQQIIRKKGGYLVITQRYMMRVDVEYVPHRAALAGPVSFELRFYPPVDLIAPTPPSLERG